MSHFDCVEAVPEPHAARVRALELAGQGGRILVTGSLYLLADLYTTRAGIKDARVNVLASFLSSGTRATSSEVGAVVAVILLWLALGYWTYRDARRRIESPLLVALATLVGLFPPYIGPFIYMLFRPPEFIDDRRERELEIRVIEARLAQADVSCPVCRANVYLSFLVCPVCTTKLKQACSSCNAPLEPMWQICPYCETPMQRARGRRAAGARDSPRGHSRAAPENF